MSNISKLRDTADILLNDEKFEEAFELYDEIYKQVLAAMGYVTVGLTKFSYEFLSYNIRSSLDFKRQFTDAAVNTIFIKWFSLDSDQTLNEFIFAIFGHLKCMSHSPRLRDKFSHEIILAEFLTLYTLILNSGTEKWISTFYRIITPVVEDTKFKRLRFNYRETEVEGLLLRSAEEIKETDWEHVNGLIIDYLGLTGHKDSFLYQTISKISGFKHTYSHWKHKKKDEEKKQEKHYSYQEHSYQDRSHHHQYQERQSEKQSEFNINTASEDEKLKYYGKILGLEGKLSKSQVRKKYLEAISKYHPDKVNSLGKELIDLAELKTKEINAAYDWLKVRFNL